MAITDADRLAAEKQFESEWRGRPKAVRARYDRHARRVVVGLDSGLELAFPPRLAQGLEHATPEQLATIEISPLGTGLHWPALDADLYVPGLLAGVFGSKRWMAAQVGPAGAQGRGQDATDTARENGGKVGRRRRVAAG